MPASMNNAVAERAVPRAKPYELRDPIWHCLLLRVQPSGVKTWYLEFERGKRIQLGRLKGSTRRRWSEEETVLALYLYFQLPFGKLQSGNPEIQQLAAALGRTSSSIAMKLCNFSSLDPKITESGRKGLDGAPKLDRATYAEFGQNL